jgi:hypothetical protein
VTKSPIALFLCVSLSYAYLLIGGLPARAEQQSLEEIFTDDKRIKIHVRRELGKEYVSSEDVEDYRKGACDAYVRYSTYPTTEIQLYCHKYSDNSVGSSLAASPGAASGHTSPEKDLHSQCLDARDYEGCLRAKTKRATSGASPSCQPGKWCMAGSGMDMLGMPMIQGWHMKYNPSNHSIGYMRPEIQRVLVRGKTDRYIANEMIVRYYQSPRAGSASTTTTFGSARTSCYDSGYSIRCKTTPPVSVTTPGVSSRPGGIVQFSVVTVIDCEEKTAARHHDGEIRGKWMPISGTSNEQLALKYCPKIETLRVSDFRKYAGK